MNNTLSSPSNSKEHASMFFSESFDVANATSRRAHIGYERQHSPTFSANTCYSNELKQINLLSTEQEKKYGSLALRGDKAASKIMIESNLRLVVKIANRYINRGLPTLDLINEGNIGLMHAASKFDPDKGFKFSTYATWWIREAIERAIIDKAPIIRIPVHICKQIKQCLNVQHTLANLKGYQPTDQEIADSMNKPVEMVNKLLNIHKDIISYDTPIGFGSDATLLELIPDESFTENYEALQEKEILRKNISSCLLELPGKQREVICQRYGLNGYSEKTLSEIAKDLQVSKERVRQLQCEGIARLKDILSKYDLNFSSVFNEPLRHSCCKGQSR